MTVGIRPEIGDELSVAFRVLGPVEVTVGAEPVRLTGRQRALLVVLLLHANQVVATDRVVDALWGESPPAAAGARVRMLVSELRRACAAAGADLVVTRAPGYLLRVAPGQLDSDLFSSALARAREAVAAAAAPQSATVAGYEAAVAAYDDALALWRGAPLAGVQGIWVDAEAARLAELRLTALEERIDACLALGRHGEMIAELTGLAADQPLRERPCARLMVALYRGGRVGDALEAYRRLRERLAAELGIEPGRELQRLHRQLLTADPALDRLEPVASPPGEFPAPPAAPRQLPADVQRLVGRDDELDSLRRALAAGDRTVLLVGAAGVGKTALAVHLAHRIADGYPDGQVFLDMRGFDRRPPMSAAEALSRLLGTLGAPADATGEDLDAQVARYRSITAGRRLLVLLDNVASADQVRPLLPGGAGCLVVVTGRDRLGGLVAADGAYRLTLDVLEPAAAVDLIAAAAGPHRLRCEPRAATELARRCGYLPLALRVAGARFANQPHRTLSGYVDELADRGRMTRLQVDGDDRSAVRAAFELSYRALPGAARRMFRLLGLVPSAGLATEAATALAGMPQRRVGDLLEDLARVHLVKAVAANRYAWHDLLGEYALDLARAEDPPVVREAAATRLLDFYLHTADRAVALAWPTAVRLPRAAVTPPVSPLDFADTADATRWLDAEWENLLAATGYAATAGPYDRAWQLADALRGALFQRRALADWAVVVGHGLAAARRERDHAAQGAMHLSYGLLHWCRAEFPASIEQDRRALRQFRLAGWRPGESAALHNGGIGLAQVGRVRAAVDRFGRALAIDREDSNRRGEAACLNNLASANEALGRLAAAERYHDLALPVLRETGHRHGEAIAQTVLGLVRLEQGRLAEALVLLTEALALSRDVGSRFQEAAALTALGAVHRDAGRYDEAATALTEAAAIARQLGDRRTEVFAQLHLAGVALRYGEPAEAVRGAAAALATAEETTHHLGRVEGLLVLAEAYGASGRHEEAAESAGQALVQARTAGYVTSVARGYAVLAAARLGLGDAEHGVELGSRAARSHRRNGQRLALARALLTTGHAHHHLGQLAAARARWRGAHTLFDEIGAPEATQTATLLSGSAGDAAGSGSAGDPAESGGDAAA